MSGIPDGRGWDPPGSRAALKERELSRKGSGNPATGGGGDGAAELQNEYNALSSQGILAAAALGVTAVQLGMTAGALTAGAGIAAVAATAASDKKNGTESSLGDYISNAFSASAKVGGSILALNLFLAMPAGIKGAMIVVAGGWGLCGKELGNDYTTVCK